MLKKRILSAIIIIFILVGIFFLNKLFLNFVLVLLLVFAIKEILAMNKNKHNAMSACAILPIIYMTFSLIFIVNKLRWESNIWWLIAAIAGASTYDTVAYFIGKNFGKHKIAPKISPCKTWEGTLAGFLGPILVSIIAGKYFLDLNYFKIILFALVMGILSFLGDLSVSWYKRKLNVKDAGCIIPGHGGLLDRIDSHLLVLIGVFYLQKII